MGKRALRISVAIQTHPERPELPARLRRMLHPSDSSKRDRTRIQVVSDPDPTGERNPWRCARECWRAADPRLDFHITVQDDALVIQDFLIHARRALTAKPDRVTAFFFSTALTVTYRDALVASGWGASWVRIHPSSWVPCVALAIPTALCPSLVTFDDGSRPCADDDVIGRWCRSLGLPAYVTIPSIVQHDDDVRSLMRDERATGSRTAAMWIGDRNPYEIDWDRD